MPTIEIEAGHYQFPGPYTTSPYRLNYFDDQLIDYCEQHRIDNKTFSTKCIVIGDKTVGKTSLVHRYLTGEFLDNYVPTIGVVFDVIRYKILGRDFRINICDTSSHERFLAPNKAYFRNISAIIIVFDHSRLATLANVRKWYNYAYRESPEACDQPLVFIVGNKCDMVSASALQFFEEEASQLAAHLSAEYWSVSAATGANFEPLFKRLGALLFSRTILAEIQQTQQLLNKLSIIATSRLEKRIKKKRKKATCFSFRATLFKAKRT